MKGPRGQEACQAYFVHCIKRTHKTQETYDYDDERAKSCWDLYEECALTRDE